HGLHCNRRLQMDVHPHQWTTEAQLLRLIEDLGDVKATKTIMYGLPLETIQRIGLEIMGLTLTLGSPENRLPIHSTMGGTQSTARSVNNNGREELEVVVKKRLGLESMRSDKEYHVTIHAEENGRGDNRFVGTRTSLTSALGQSSL
ncbi:hypothetical protein PENTCL1PPCAC_1302, partial [Pristionchus entomophagus]